ncbi:MAG: TRAP transporter large permease subunit, partial [Deinococcota bacterium]|nr:TRAP transporter large permease subunit [Deinococcota bacterium]
MTDPQVGILMLGAFVLTILLGFPIAFTLIAMSVGFGYYAIGDTIFPLLVQRTFGVMANDVLISVPLFLFMGYVVERANILGRLFSSLQVAAKNIPASLAVATLVTCALFATATGIVGAVVTLMGLLALPEMIKARYDIKLSSGVICAGGCLGILIPPSIMLILYGATAGVSVVRLYAGALLPGFLLAGLYILYVIGRAVINPSLAPKLPKDQTDVPLGRVLVMMLTSFLPLAVLILSVLGAILLGVATPSEAAAIGALGALLLAAGYRQLTFTRLKEAVFLTARTS